MLAAVEADREQLSALRDAIAARERVREEELR
jgi:hypothetical protein